MRVLLDDVMGLMKQTHFFVHSASALVEIVFTARRTISEKILRCYVLKIFSYLDGKTMKIRCKLIELIERKFTALAPLRLKMESPKSHCVIGPSRRLASDIYVVLFFCVH